MQEINLISKAYLVIIEERAFFEQNRSKLNKLIGDQLADRSPVIQRHTQISIAQLTRLAQFEQLIVAFVVARVDADDAVLLVVESVQAVAGLLSQRAHQFISVDLRS